GLDTAGCSSTSDRSMPTTAALDSVAYTTAPPLKVCDDPGTSARRWQTMPAVADSAAATVAPADSSRSWTTCSMEAASVPATAIPSRSTTSSTQSCALAHASSRSDPVAVTLTCTSW